MLDKSVDQPYQSMCRRLLFRSDKDESRTLKGQTVYLFNGSTIHSDTVTVPKCVICGEHPVVQKTIDDAAKCALEERLQGREDEVPQLHQRRTEGREPPSHRQRVPGVQTEVGDQGGQDSTRLSLEEERHFFLLAMGRSLEQWVKELTHIKSEELRVLAEAIACVFENRKPVVPRRKKRTPKWRARPRSPNPRLSHHPPKHHPTRRDTQLSHPEERTGPGRPRTPPTSSR
jgi:hypothetical protein